MVQRGEPTVDGSGGLSAFESRLGARLEELVPGVSVTGIAGSAPVDVVSVRWAGGNAIVLTYRDAHDGTAPASPSSGVTTSRACMSPSPA